MGAEQGTDTEEYDYVIIGTGLAETAVSCTLAKTGKYKILHLDSAGTYGSEFSTLQYRALLDHFGTEPGPCDSSLLARSAEFSVDLTPKLLLQDSQLKDFLLANEIQDLVSFTAVHGSFLFTTKLHAVPTNEAQALRSGAVSLLQKPRVIRFFWNVRAFFRGSSTAVKNTMREEFAGFGLSTDSMDFIGHAVALNLNDDYLNEDPCRTYRRIVQYVSSVACYEGSESPYIYPLYGLSELCQAFARRSALYGSVFMLNARIAQAAGGELSVTDPDGGTHRIKARRIIADPRALPGSRISKQIIRCIMVLRNSGASRNVIFLKKQLGRQNDIFCVILGPDEMACPAGHEVGILSTVRETDNPEAEIAPVLARFDILRRFTEVRDLCENDDRDNIIFTKGVDESALMDNIYADIERILEKLKE